MTKSIFRTDALATLIAVCLSILTASMALAQDDEAVLVNVDNFARAETSAQFDRGLAVVDGLNKWLHFREPTPLDRQTVIRMNRDTLYSSTIVDITKGATLTIPDAGDRYMSVMAVNEDHYINKVFHGAGTYELTVEEFHTPYLGLAVRTLVDASDPDDIAIANALQDQLKVESVSSQPYTHPEYDEVSYQATFDALIELGRGMSDTHRTFGKKEGVDPVRHLLATAWGWGGLPIEEAFYLNVDPGVAVGAYQLTVRDVPVDAFWSITVYGADGFLHENDFNAYSVNNITATPNPDGSITVNFGGAPGNVNHLPISEGWNYTVRLYQPREEVIDGTWVFPAVEPVR